MIILSLIASLVVGLAAVGGQDGAPEGQQSQLPIRVVSNSHEVKFPSEVVFRLDAEANSPITRVTLFYRLANQSVRVYGYPEFTSATRVSTDFSLKTGGSSFLPSGVDIEYYYEIEDASGDRIETPRVTLEYLDPAYKWHRISEGPLELVWHNRPEERVRSVASEVAGRLAAVKTMFGLDAAPPIKAVLVNSGREASRSFPKVSRAASRGHIYGGFAFREYDLFVLVGLSANGMVHEATHLLLAEAMGARISKVPSWLNEGLSMYFESNGRRGDATVKRALRRDSLLSLRSMNRVPGKPSDVRMFYAQAASIVTYMVEEYGRERMSWLLGTLEGGKRLDQALTEVYGVDVGQLEGQWKAGLAGETLMAPRPDIGTAVVSGLYAGSVAIAIIFTLLRWLSHQTGSGNAAP